jgi:hypothetical protein
LADVTNPRRPLVTQLTPTKPNVTAMVMEVSLKTPDTVIIGMNDRDPKYKMILLQVITFRYFDPYTVNLRTGQMNKIFNNTRYGELIFDDTLQLRFATEPRDDGGVIYWRFTGPRMDSFYLSLNSSWQVQRDFCL